MTEIWIHRKCARPASVAGPGDELVQPKQFERGKVCEFCGGVVDAVYLHEGEEFNVTAPVEAVEAVEGTSAEFTPTEVPDLILPEEANSEEPSEELPLSPEPLEEDPPQAKTSEEPLEVESEQSEPLEEEGLDIVSTAIVGEIVTDSVEEVIVDERTASKALATKKASKAKKTEIDALKAQIEALEK